MSCTVHLLLPFHCDFNVLVFTGLSLVMKVIIFQYVLMISLEVFLRESLLGDRIQKTNSHESSLTEKTKIIVYCINTSRPA